MQSGIHLAMIRCFLLALPIATLSLISSSEHLVTCAMLAAVLRHGTARRLTESVADAASAACDSLLHAESLIQLGLLPKPCSHVLRVPHVRQSYNWSAACSLALAPALLQCRYALLPQHRGASGRAASPLPSELMWPLMRRDCGLACVLMVLKAAGVHTEDLASLRAACCTTRYPPNT